MRSVPEVIKLFSYSTQLSMEIRMPKIVGIFIFIGNDIFCSAMFSKKEFAIVSNLRSISRTNFFFIIILPIT